MEYAVLIYDRPGAYAELPGAELDAVMGEYLALSKEPQVTGGRQLQPIDTATTVRASGGESLVTDGPFADTKEVFGGFYLIDVDGPEAAQAFAARIPTVRLGGSVEVRPVVERDR